MSTVHHEPHGYHADLTSAELNRPLGELDAAIETVITTGSGVSTTLTAQASAGQATLLVASSAGYVTGDPIYIGTGAMFEPRIVNTVPGGGVTITVTVNLSNTYAAGKPVSKSPVEIVAARGGSTTLGGRIGLIESRVFDVRVWGADPTGAADSTSAIAATHAAVVASGKPGVVSLGSGRYKITSTLAIDVALAALVGNGAVIDATAIHTTPAIQVTNSDPDGWGPRNDVTQRIEGFQLIGPGTENYGVAQFDPHRYVQAAMDGSVGIFFNGGSHTTASNVSILCFDHGVDFGDSAYLIRLRGMSIWKNNIGLYSLPGATDNRENTSLSDCAIFNNWVAVGNNGYEFFFSDCSFDGNTKVFDLQGGNCALSDCHMEGDVEHNAIQLTGWNAYLSWIGGSIIGMNGSDYIVEGTEGSVNFDSVWMHNVNTTTGQFAGGATRVTFSNMAGALSSEFMGMANSALSDGSFEGAVINDDWFISDDTAAITDRNTGANITLAISSAAAYTGAHSLKIGKAGAATTVAGATVVAPVKKNSRPAVRFYHRKLDDGTGSAWFSWGFCNVRVNGSGVPYLHMKSELGAEQITWTGATDWTLSAVARAAQNVTPPWATHFYVLFDLGNLVGPHDIYIDDMQISEM